VRCILDTAHNAHEISLAENVIRSVMHPADQFEAFSKLHNEQGMAAEDIAARFGVSPTVVRQRLKLGAVSPKLVKAYRDEELSLDELTAFAITDDHARQEQVWNELPPYHRSRETILRSLSEGQVAFDDRRAVFVGAGAYQAAGGAIIRDLFDDEGGGFFADAALLNRLVREKLAEEAAQVEAEGWKWVVAEPEFSHELAAGMRRVYPEAVPLSDEDQAKLDELEQSHNALCDEDDGSEEIAAKMQALEAEIDALTGEEQYQPDDIAMAGAFVCLDHRGEPRVERGFVRAEDWKAKVSASDCTEPDGNGETDRTDRVKPLSERLVAELTAYRTAGLRNALAEHPATALTAVVHALAAATFYSWSNRMSCLEIVPRSATLAAHASGIDECPAMTAIAERHAAWERRLPEDASELWGFVAGLDQAQQLELLAHCASLSVNAMQVPKNRAEKAVSAYADVLAETLGLNMAATWTPTVANYLGRVSKERIAEAVREGASAQAAANIAQLKKGDMAAMAEDFLKGKGWLPELLRTSL
jgi:ParB family transcriptional regulator, chromosome partitioning protein